MSISNAFNLRSRCKVSSEEGEVGITLCGHLVGTYGGVEGQIGQISK